MTRLCAALADTPFGAGAIPTVKLGRYYRYRLQAIERWIVEREQAA